MGAVVDGLKIRQQGIRATLRDLAYKRLLLTSQVEEIDKTITGLEAMEQANAAVEQDISKAALEAASDLADMTPEEADKATNCDDKQGE